MKHCKCGQAILPGVDKTKPSETIIVSDGNHLGKVILFPSQDPSGNLCYHHQKEEDGKYNFTKSADKICLEGELLWRNLRKNKEKFVHRSLR